MYSDDSEASEVASEPEDVSGNGASEDESDIAESSHINENKQKDSKTHAKHAVLNAYEEDEDGYSVNFEDDFEDDFEEPDEKKQPLVGISSPARTLSPTRSATSNTRRRADDASGHDYDEASFEEESHRSLSQRSLSTSNRIVNLSVRSCSPSFRPAPDIAANDRSGAGFALSPETRFPVKDAKVYPRSALAPLAENNIDASMQSKHFSLLMRKVESKFEDELIELREKNALLTWKERELRASLRRSKEELTIRKDRIQKKRRRAADRRRDHERAAERVQRELDAAQASIVERDRRIEGLQSEFVKVQEMLQNVEREKHGAEERSMALTDKLQTALADFHQLACSFEEAVNAKLACEQRIEELKGNYQVQLQVLEHKCRVDIEAAHRALADEVAARTAERQTLPEIHQRIVEAEKERFEKLEAALLKQIRELESRAAQDALTHAAELAQATEAKHQADQRADRRIQDEIDRIARERIAVDEQRSELLASMARTNARFDEERGMMEAKSCELDARRSELADERAELEAHKGYIEQRMRRLEEGEALVERRRSELAAIGRETLERSHALARRAQEFTNAIVEGEKLRTLVKTLTERSERSEQRLLMLEQDRERFETEAQALQQERLVVAKQRMQSRYFLDGARKLESMLHQKHCVMEVADKRVLSWPNATFYTCNQHDHHDTKNPC